MKRDRALREPKLARYLGLGLAGRETLFHRGSRPVGMLDGIGLRAEDDLSSRDRQIEGPRRD